MVHAAVPESLTLTCSAILATNSHVRLTSAKHPDIYAAKNIFLCSGSRTYALSLASLQASESPPSEHSNSKLTHLALLRSPRHERCDSRSPLWRAIELRRASRSRHSVFLFKTPDFTRTRRQKKKATCRRLQLRTPSNSTSNTSHCFALKNVDGPTGEPSSGGTTRRLRPPTRMVLMPSSNPEQHTPSFRQNLADWSFNYWTKELVATQL